MTRIEDFSDATQELADELIDRPFPDALPVLERWFNGLTRKGLIFWESYWRQYGPPTSEREMWEAVKYAPEKQAAKRPSVRREVVVIFGHKVTVFRDTRSGRWVRRGRRK